MKIGVLHSGGLDSSVLLHLLSTKYVKANIHTFSVEYGQKHDKEVECGRKFRRAIGLTENNHHSLNLEAVFSGYKHPLLKGETSVPTGSYDEQAKAADGVVATYVPFRNGLMISAAASRCLQLGVEKLFVGMHADDALGNAYPDCSVDFVDAMRQAIWEGSDKPLRLEAPFISMNKVSIARIAHALETPVDLTWSCYVGKEKPCGKCGTCIDRNLALCQAGFDIHKEDTK